MMSDTHPLLSSDPAACTSLYFSHSLGEMRGAWRCSELQEILILTIDTKIFKAEAGILSYSLDP